MPKNSTEEAHCCHLTHQSCFSLLRFSLLLLTLAHPECEKTHMRMCMCKCAYTIVTVHRSNRPLLTFAHQCALPSLVRHGHEQLPPGPRGDIKSLQYQILLRHVYTSITLFNDWTTPQGKDFIDISLTSLSLRSCSSLLLCSTASLFSAARRCSSSFWERTTKNYLMYTL